VEVTHQAVVKGVSGIPLAISHNKKACLDKCFVNHQETQTKFIICGVIVFFEPPKLPEIPEDNDMYVVICLHSFTKVFMEVGHLS